MSWFTTASGKIAQVIEQLATANARIEALDTEVHRMLEEFKRLWGEWSASSEGHRKHVQERYEAIFQRVVTLEALVSATLERAAQVEAREGARQGAREAIEAAELRVRAKALPEPEE